MRDFRLDRASFSNFLERRARGERGGFARQCLPAPDSNVDLGRVEFERTSLAAGSLGGNQNGAAAAKRVENDIALFGAITNGVRDKRHGFDGWMHL